MCLTNIRLASQQLSGTTLSTSADLVSWMGAMQAQDYNMAKWAIGLRLHITEAAVEEAFNKGEFIRTHVMRPTWHFVAPQNIRWMLQLTAPRIKSSMRSRDRELELTKELYDKSNKVIQKALEGNKNLTREELVLELEKAKIVLNPSRIIHFMMYAEMDGVICSGAVRKKKQTYALLEERIPQTNSLHKDEALVQFARIYFRSHSPATLQDFVWWSGLPAADARHAIEMIKTELISETIDTQVYWIADSYLPTDQKNESIHLLPAFDEYIISYKDRKAILHPDNHSKAISNNGIFRPAIMKNGQIIGIWKKATSKGKLVIPDFFEQPDKHTLRMMDEASIIYGAFLDTKTA